MQLKQAIPAVFTIVAALGVSSVASADDAASLAGTYGVRIQDVSNSCTDAGMKLDRGTLTITGKGDELNVRLLQLPVMSGKARKGGKIKVAAAKTSTPAAKADASFSAAGHVENGRVQFVLVAEYYRGDKALCTQSWDVSGSRR